MRRVRVGVVLAMVAAAAAGTSASARPPERDAGSPASDARAAAVGRALARLGGSAADFRVRDVVLDAGGGEHVRFDRYYGGLEVLGGDLVVHGGRDGSSRGTSGGVGALRLSRTPRVPAREAAAIGARTLAGSAVRATPRLVVSALSGAPVLAWETVVEGTSAAGDPSELHVVVSANDGRVLDSWDGIETVDGSGHALYVGDVTLQTNATATGYELRDTSRGNGYTTDLRGATSGIGAIFTGVDNDWGTGAHGFTGTARESAAVDAHYGVARTWDYFKASHDRLGIANDGKGTYSRVHYGSNYDNAFWSDTCFCMTFGDGDGSTDGPLVSLDIAGHEMTHGITSRTANLKYSGESGGLNEATSDIFGTMVEFSAGGASDPGDYGIGEEILRPYTGQGFRFMYHPSLDGASPDCWSKSLGRLNVHYSSGVANRFFFLLAEGTASPLGDGLAGCKGAPAVTGLGRDAAARVWYRALTVYMTSRTDYVGARAATIRAATDLGYSTATVKAAWNAVAVPVSTSG
ncbi:MAG TPA: M4 family metallopeptidase [Frankiaceae bacterium]|nr:M4 family metallopeptidase [Frankiaceae bacterium]